jgi:hypothetical protein
VKRITTLLTTLALILALPSTASADTSDGGVTWITNNLYGYNHFIQVCTYAFNTDADNRVADAAAEWTELGGELAFVYAGWDDSNCLANWNANGNIVYVSGNGDLGGDTLGSTTCYRQLGTGCGPATGWGSVVRCRIMLDMDNYTTSYGTYSWYMGTGLPGSEQIDIESVVVHELGHCLARAGHDTHSGHESYVMDDSLGNPSDPEGVENDELLWSHDKALYTDFYGTTH